MERVQLILSANKGTDSVIEVMQQQYGVDNYCWGYITYPYFGKKDSLFKYIVRILDLGLFIFNKFEKPVYLQSDMICNDCTIIEVDEKAYIITIAYLKDAMVIVKDISISEYIIAVQSGYVSINKNFFVFNVLYICR